MLMRRLPLMESPSEIHLSPIPKLLRTVRRHFIIALVVQIICILLSAFAVHFGGDALLEDNPSFSPRPVNFVILTRDRV